MDTRIAVIACGALSVDVSSAATELEVSLAIYPLPPLLHNRPERIAGEVEKLFNDIVDSYDRVVIAYADCGTYGALDEVCDRLGISRLPGDHCYDVYAGAAELKSELEAQPGTYLLTDFLVMSFNRTVVRELGLDKHPELRDDYFRNYTRAVWLAGRRTALLDERAHQAAQILGLPLEIIEVGNVRMKSALGTLVS